MATLGEQVVGSSVKLNVNGTAWEFIVVHQGLPGTMYDMSCNGTWLLMKDIYESRVWDSSNENNYENSEIHEYLNSTFVGLFDDDIKNVICHAIIPYTKGTGSGTVVTGADGLPAYVFLLSYTEVGYTSTNTSSGWVEGAALEYFNGAANSKRIAKLNGTSTIWRHRSPVRNNKVSSTETETDGTADIDGVKWARGIRPALILPYELGVDGSGIVMVPSGAITGTVIINGVQRELTGAGYINIGGVLRDLSDSQSNIGGTLKSMKG